MAKIDLIMTLGRVSEFSLSTRSRPGSLVLLLANHSDHIIKINNDNDIFFNSKMSVFQSNRFLLVIGCPMKKEKLRESFQ